MEAEDVLAATASADSWRRRSGGPAGSPADASQYTSLEWHDLDKTRFLLLNPSVFALIRLLQHPAAVIKTRYQLQQHNRLYSSPATVFSQTLRNEGVRGLYRGFGTSALMLVVQQAYIVMYEFLRASDRYEGVWSATAADARAGGGGGDGDSGGGGGGTSGATPPLSDRHAQPVVLSESMRNAIAAATSVLTVQVLANPIDVVAQRLMMQGQRVSNAPQMAPEPPSTASMVGPVASGTAAGTPPSSTMLPTAGAAPGAPTAAAGTQAAIAAQPAATPAANSVLRVPSTAPAPNRPTAPSMAVAATAAPGAAAAPAAAPHAAVATAAAAPPHAAGAPASANPPSGGVWRGNRLVSGGGVGAQTAAAADVVKLAQSTRLPPPAPIPRVLTAMEIAGQVWRSRGAVGFYSGFAISCLQFMPSASLWWFVYPIYRDTILPYLQPAAAATGAPAPALAPVPVTAVVPVQHGGSAQARATAASPARVDGASTPGARDNHAPSTTPPSLGPEDDASGSWRGMVGRARAWVATMASLTDPGADAATPATAAASSVPLSSLASMVPPARIAEVLAGGAASMTVSLAMNPLDIIRTRTQVEGHAAVAVARALLATEGVRGLWKGTTARMAMLVPQGALTIAAYELVKRLSALPPEQRDAGSRREAPGALR